MVKWHIDGHDYFWAVSEIISVSDLGKLCTALGLTTGPQLARECIMIQDWWLTPGVLLYHNAASPQLTYFEELYLRRPPAKFPEWRIDRLLKSKAQQGVKVYIIVYKASLLVAFTPSYSC